jgi:hypothetical protein
VTFHPLGQVPEWPHARHAVDCICFWRYVAVAKWDVEFTPEFGEWWGDLKRGD